MVKYKPKAARLPADRSFLQVLLLIRAGACFVAALVVAGPGLHLPKFSSGFDLWLPEAPAARRGGGGRGSCTFQGSCTELPAEDALRDGCLREVGENTSPFSSQAKSICLLNKGGSGPVIITRHPLGSMRVTFSNTSTSELWWLQ